MSKISIVVPVYNVALYLPMCIDSILRQSFSDFELLLIDDGSTDESGKICDRFAEGDNRITVVHQQNSGAASAKNVGIDMATGEYIAFIDSDDWVESNWLERVLAVFRSTSASAVEYSFIRECLQGRERGNESDFTTRLFTAEEYMAQYLDNWTCSLFWNKIFRRELLKKIRFRKERRCIDDEFFTYKVISGAAYVARINDELYHYRQRENSAVTDDRNKMQIIDDAMELRPERYEWIKKHFPKLKNYYLEHDMGFLLYWGKCNIFSRPLIQKYKRIVRYYVYEGMKVKWNIRILKLAIALMLSKPKTENNINPINL